MRLKLLNALIFIVILGSFSCTSYKKVPYFQDLPQDSVVVEPITNFKATTINKSDLLAIFVSSSNHEADAIVNYNLERPNGVSNLDRSEQNTITGYLVNSNGDIKVPYIGNVHVQGLTLEQIEATLKTRLGEYLQNPNVIVKLESYKVSILGDVRTPGSYTVATPNITLTQALSLAGDLNTTGVRNILLIREEDGQRKYIRLDLTSKKTLTSPYYYLRNNDVIYVQPNKERVSMSDSAFQKASIIISAMSLLAIFITRYN